MNIELHKVTSFSTAVAIVLYVVTFVGAFYLGEEYSRVESGAYINATEEVHRDSSQEIMATTSDISLGVGQTGRFGTFALTFNGMVQDSRCPIDVQCIQAGAVNTNVTFEDGTQRETKNMPSDEVPQKFEDYHIAIVDVAPDRHSGVEIPGKKYVVTFRVTKK